MKANINYTAKEYGRKLYVNVNIDGETFEAQFEISKKGQHTGYNLIKTNIDTTKYMVGFEFGEGLILIEKSNTSYEVGQIVEHKVYGKGEIIEVGTNVLRIQFGSETKMIMKAIAANFFK